MRDDPGGTTGTWHTAPSAAARLRDKGQEDGFLRAAEIQGDVLKEVMRRSELRQRLEAERGGPISDEEFLEIAERSGGVEL